MPDRIEFRSIRQVYCQIEHQIECQNASQIHCQNTCQIESQCTCQIACQIECQNICQMECQRDCQNKQLLDRMPEYMSVISCLSGCFQGPPGFCFGRRVLHLGGKWQNSCWIIVPNKMGKNLSFRFEVCPGTCCSFMIKAAQNPNVVIRLIFVHTSFNKVY